MKARGNQPDGREDMHSSTHWHAPTHEKIHAYHKKNTIWKKLAVSVAAVATAIGGVTVTTSAAQAATNRDSYADTVENSTFQAARAKYGLAEQMSEGATLHAWEWSFKTIEQHIPEIAAAGYTSVQTEPISAIHTGNKGKIFTENWYYVYQPTDTTIGNWVMGSESDLKSLCATAHKYGVRIIVDVVANHMTATWNAIADRWKKSDLYHHDCNDGDVQDYNNRYQVTHCKLLSLYDINTSKTETANMMHDYLVQAVNDGVDGFRFDAAKHIELPNEYDGSQYWNIVLNNGAQFQYGEVLQDSISHDADYAKLFANNSRHGGGVTASYYGVKLRGALSSKNLNAGNLNNWDNAAGGNNLVSWVESHDNYSNKPDDYGASMKMSEWEMTMGWGVIGSRSQTMPLYFDRPVGSGGNQPQFAEKSQLGDAGSDSWKDSQVVAVNHFRNKMNNAKAKEYMRNCGDNSCLMVERYIKDGNADSDGVTVVNMNGDKSLAGTETTLDDGTYTDQVNGGTLTVSGGKITSGTAKGGKISVFYNSNLASVSANPTGGSFKTDTTKVTLHASNVTSASYTTSEGSSGSYQDGDTIAIGAKTAVNGTITLKLQGTDKDGKTVSAEYTFTKKDPAAVSVAYAKKPSNWSNLYAYVYVDDSSAATLKQNAKWPGVAMTKVSAGDSCGKDGEYKYEIPDGFDENVRIIFNDGNATNTLKYPADTAEGEDAAGLSIDGTYAWNGDTTASGTWTARSCAVVTVNSVKINQKDFTTDLTNGAKTIKLTATTDPAGVNVSWSSSNEAVAKVASDGTVTPVKAGTAKITAKSGGKTASITVTVTGVPPLDPVGKNTIYATKPSDWGDLYAYVYTGDGATAANNAAWPGVKMTATTASDGCRQANAYRYAVPDDLAKGAKVIFVDPRMPENAMSSGAEWVPIRPGTDAAFLLSMIGVGLTEKLVDFEFLRRYTNAPYLIEVGTHRPIVANELIEGASKDAFVVMNRAASAYAAMGLARDEKGAVTGFDEPEGVDPDLDYAGTVRTVDGRDLAVETAFVRFSKTAMAWTPEKASLTTGIPSETIVRIARAFFTEGGVCDDGWYASRNGNDTHAYALMSMINLFTGQIDQPGGFVVTQGGGFKGPGASQSGGKGKGPHGESWENAEGKALDKVLYPEGSGTYSAIFSAIEEGKPYPIRAAFITGSTMFHREANSDRMARAFKALDLMVVQDIFPHEVIDYADYVLPSTFFLEAYEYGGVKWALNGNVQFSNAGIEPPEGCDARDEIWQFCEILRRAFPERAKERLGYDHEMKTREEFKKWYRGMMDGAWTKFIAKKNSDKPGEGDRIDADVKARGWSQVSAKKFGVYPQKKPFGTPTGKGEIISFLFAGKYEKKGASGLSDWVMPPAYTIPRPRSNEFYLVSGKDSASNSGVSMWTWPTKFLGDRTVWMNPVDAERLGIRTGDTVELTSLDTGVKGRTQVTVTNRVVAGSLFAHGFAGGVRTKRNLGAYEWTREGINSHWFCTGYREPVTGSLANNSTVRVERI